MSKRARKRKLEGEELSMVEWEQENIFPEKARNEMETMWEIPQMFHFLHLAKEALNIPQLSMYEMERMLLIPRASKQLANVMTSLLSAPMSKAKWRTIPPMPYDFWTNILAYKMSTWFKIYETKHQDAVKVLEIIGVEPEFWNVFPNAPLLNGKDFEELTFKQRVWLLKTVCDTVMHARKTVQEEMSKQPWEDQFETLLGTDRHGARYIYFPQFLKSDLRVYRHCLDNNILSTVKPIKPKLEAKSQNKLSDRNALMKKKAKHRRRKSRWRNGLPPRLKRKANKCDEKHLNDCKCNSDSATGSLINEDTNLSSTSTCSNNNNSNSNNNNISLDTISVKRSRSSSKCSETSIESDKSCSKSTRSSGYDTNSSVGIVSGKRSSQRMFKGFSDNSNNNKCNIEIISGILNDLKSDTSEGKSTEDMEISLTRTSQNKLELNATRQQYLDTMDLQRGGSVDRTIDNLSGISKTDDEKLNEIISAESMKLNDKSSDNVLTRRKTKQISITSKSDDEKLNETRTGHRQNDSGNSSRENRESRFMRRNGRLVEQKSDKEPVRSNNTSKSTDDTESIDRKNLSLSELRSLLREEAMDDDLSFDEDSEVKCSLRKLKTEKSNGRKQEMEDFNEMLLELSVSKFQLIADSVSSLSELIATFSQKSNSSKVNTDNELEHMPLCEVKLVNKMRELLSSLEEIEPALRESTKKARGKLQREWTNFKKGSAEDQDSSGEGLGSNWWVLGSQGCPLPASGDASVQALSQSTISPASSQNISSTNEEERVDHAEHSSNDGQTCGECKKENVQDDSQGEQAEQDRGNGQENGGTEEDAKEEDSNEEGEQKTRRVLRARGVSSYTAQFYSDDEIEENELEEWTDVEAVYAAPSTQASSSTAHVSTKIKCVNDRTNEEDSDQDWILPSSRKRKSKRPSANRRLKSFQYKLQNIKVADLQDAAESRVATPSTTKTNQEKPRIKEIQICKPNKPTDPEAPYSNSIPENHEAVVENNPKDIVSSTETTCKVENVASVHSELDIKDEGPIYDSTPCNFANSYATTYNPNYMIPQRESDPVNYYVMQPNLNTADSQNSFMQTGPVVSSIMPPFQQAYHLHGGQNYIIQNPQSSFVPPQPFQPQGPQMMTPQQFINHTAYVPYMVPPAQHHPGHISMDQQLIHGQMLQNPANSVHLNSTPLTRPPQSRYHVPRQNYPHPNGAVIRSRVPIRGYAPRASNVRPVRNVQQQRNTPVRTQKARKPSAPSENSGQKTTSLIVLSDSDDEIEMIITEQTGPEAAAADKTKTMPKRSNEQPRQMPIVTSDVTVAPKKNAISPQIIQRMNQGGISIIPVKSTPPVQNTGTQLVVVVNETGSHYALALPNGSKLILTPEQVAQIRASNGGKLVL